MLVRLKIFITLLVIAAAYGCSGSLAGGSSTVFKGVYTSGEEVKSYKDCDSGGEYFVNDRSGDLEKDYAKLKVEKAYIPVYIEVEAQKVKSDNQGKGAGFDSTLVIKKVIKIIKNIPQDMCN